MTAQTERTVRSYFDSFAPAPNWDDLVGWPPDVFALANLVLDHTESYRFVVAPPPGRRWPPLKDWNAEIPHAARAWRDACVTSGGALPPLVRDSWGIVTRSSDVSLAEVRSGAAWELVAALVTLHAIADEACAGVVSAAPRIGGSFERSAWALLESRGSLSRLSPIRVRIVPKTNFSPRGITIRSLSRYLGLCYEPVQVTWRRTDGPAAAAPSAYNIVLLPWPLSLRADDFRPAPHPQLENMDVDLFDFFEFAPDTAFDRELLGAVLEQATGAAGRVDAVVLPEAAVHAAEVAGLERRLAELGVTFLIAGVREPPTDSLQGRNYLHFGIRGDLGWNRFEQDKHHRWCLDAGQIRQYHLTKALDPSKLWWEAIDVRERAFHVIDLGGGITTAPMVCEDLASLDEVADLVRRAGPSLVVSVLLDGPQLRSRWPCRYGSILTDDPGSAVLTLTSFGMVRRCRPPGKPSSRVVAHWNSPVDGLREVELAARASAVLLSTCIESSTLWTADGRRHSDVPRLKLCGVRQLRVPRRQSDELPFQAPSARRRYASTASCLPSVLTSRT